MLQFSAAPGERHLAAPATAIIFMAFPKTVLILLADCVTIRRLTWGRDVGFTERAFLGFRTYDISFGFRT
jgi:hypothetical protein